MHYDSSGIDDYIRQIPDERKDVFKKLRTTIKDNLPDGFEETLQYKMPAFVVPHSTYPDGYHVNPKLPLHFINIASQKNYIALYHTGIYADKKLHEWFVSEYPKHCKHRLDMGKSCVRFKKIDDIPFDLIAELSKKVTVKDWIKLYENNIKPQR